MSMVHMRTKEQGRFKPDVEELENIHKTFSQLTESLGFVYLHSLDMLKVPCKTAYYLSVWIYFTQFDDPVFGTRNNALWHPSR